MVSSYNALLQCSISSRSTDHKGLLLFEVKKLRICSTMSSLYSFCWLILWHPAHRLVLYSSISLYIKFADEASSNRNSFCACHCCFELNLSLLFQACWWVWLADYTGKCSCRIRNRWWGTRKIRIYQWRMGAGWEWRGWLRCHKIQIHIKKHIKT